MLVRLFRFLVGRDIRSSNPSQPEFSNIAFNSMKKVSDGAAALLRVSLLSTIVGVLIPRIITASTWVELTGTTLGLVIVFLFCLMLHLRLSFWIIGEVFSFLKIPEMAEEYLSGPDEVGKAHAVASSFGSIFGKTLALLIHACILLLLFFATLLGIEIHGELFS